MTASATIAWFYKPEVNGNITEMMKYGTMVLTRGDEATITALRTAGYLPNIHQYVRGEAIQKTTGTPAKNQVAWNVGDWNSISTNHPDWFMLDSGGNKIPATVGSTYYMMDPASTGWQQFFIDRVNTYQAGAGSGFSGLFMDNLEASLVKRQQQGNVIPAKYPTDALYRAAVMSFITAVKAGVSHTILGNIINFHDSSEFLPYVNLMDGGFSERTYADYHTGYLSVADWLDDLNLAVAGKECIFVTQSNTNDSARELFTFASFLLAQQTGNAFRFTSAANYNQSWWYDNFLTNIGTPNGSVTQSGQNYSRAYTGGSVTVNPTTHTASINTGTSLTLSVDAGSFAETGTATTLKITRNRTCDAGSYNMTGTAATLIITQASPTNVAYALDALHGTFSLTGHATTLTLDAVPVVARHQRHPKSSQARNRNHEVAAVNHDSIPAAVSRNHTFYAGKLGGGQ